MTRKDYVCIARAIKSVAVSTARTACWQNERDAINRVAVSIASALKADNPNFQYAKFLAAAGYPIEEIAR